MAATVGDTVKVGYTGRLDNGSVFDSSADGEPIEFTIGAGSVIPGFEAAVLGMQAGDTTTVTISADNAYGPVRPDLIGVVSKDAFLTEPFVGGGVTVTSPEGEQLEGIIVSIEGDDVKLDFNHPLAGEALTFDLELVEIVTHAY